MKFEDLTNLIEKEHSPFGEHFYFTMLTELSEQINKTIKGVKNYGKRI